MVTGNLDDKYRKIANIINNEKQLVMCYIEANSIGEPMINEIRKLVINKLKVQYYTTTNENKAENVGNLQLAIAQNEIFFNREDAELYKQLAVFTYKISKQTRRITYAAKEPFHDDRVMSLLIAKRAMEDFKFNTTQNTTFIKNLASRKIR